MTRSGLVRANLLLLLLLVVIVAVVSHWQQLHLICRQTFLVELDGLTLLASLGLTLQTCVISRATQLQPAGAGMQLNGSLVKLGVALRTWPASNSVVVAPRAIEKRP